jgi:fatty-acyl-CoA synthase
VDVRVLTVAGERCPPRAQGAIWVRSRDSLGASQPDAAGGTARAAVPAGDVGWFDSGGRLFISGRSDDMIITGGENVYPVEIENTLEQHPAVLEAAVTGVPDQEYGQVLAAHLVLRHGQDVAPGELRSWCRARLAPFQVPRRFVVHDALPRNASGKVVKSKLGEHAA